MYGVNLRDMMRNQDVVPELDEEHGQLSYRGWRFSYAAERTPAGFYKPTVRRLSQQPGEPDEVLPTDTEEIAYATEAEAIRHGQQQAVRWVHDRTGHGQGQF